MKKTIALALATLVILSSCAKKEEPKPAAEAPKLKVVLILNGTLGDKSFFDSAANGMDLVKADMGDAVETKVIEMGYDQSKWEPTLIDVAEGPWDIVICGTWQMTEALQKVAKDYPQKRFIIFDTAVDYSLGLANVYSIEYSQNEASFLAGALASYVTGSSLPLANKQKVVGFLGGMDIPVINDFLVGYIEGARYVDPAVKVAISYIGSFDDSAKGKEMALAQYAQGADIGYNVAGQAGLGQLDAAKDVKRYAIGVDSDQAAIFATSDPDKAKLITTSVLKRVDNSLLRAIQMHAKGTAPYGKSETLGFAEKCVGLAKNDIYMQLIPADARAKLDDIEAKIIAKEIKVGTALGMSTEDLNKIRNAVKP
ncbi:MAG: BMP family ABC transporter substrate-binding protein [Spirochaetes bacterium]|nr:BMP family ABC transporter substrate-binding protein [Spirochaetota bacterium]MBU1079433.1 BMP family ABC transporter substrate-binding protein [Spirochaetota bacterium]